VVVGSPTAFLVRWVDLEVACRDDRRSLRRRREDGTRELPLFTSSAERLARGAGQPKETTVLGEMRLDDPARERGFVVGGPLSVVRGVVRLFVHAALVGLAGRVATFATEAAVAEVNVQIYPNPGTSLVGISYHHSDSIALPRDRTAGV
jgi:hypothetical protein